MLKELGEVEVPAELAPTSLQQMQAKLEGAGLDATYGVMDDMLKIEREGDRLLFAICQAIDHPVFARPPCIELAGDLADEAETIILLREIFEAAYPGCQCSFYGSK